MSKHIEHTSFSSLSVDNIFFFDDVDVDVDDDISVSVDDNLLCSVQFSTVEIDSSNEGGYVIDCVGVN